MAKSETQIDPTSKPAKKLTSGHDRSKVKRVKITPARPPKKPA